LWSFDWASDKGKALFDPELHVLTDPGVVFALEQERGLAVRTALTLGYGFFCDFVVGSWLACLRERIFRLRVTRVYG
jgi:hypothetical protein